MIFVIAAVFILVISFVVALVSLIREQSKIEKENVAFGENDGKPKAEKFQAGNQHVSEPDLATLKVDQTQTQPQTPSLDFNALHLAEKPWWEKEIQKRDDGPQNHIVQEENIAEASRQQGLEVPIVQSPSQVLGEEKPGGQTPQEGSANLQGSFAVSDLTKQDQES